MSQPASSILQREVPLRFLSHDDIQEVRKLCEEWFPIEYPDAWYEEITSNPKFYALAATYKCQIIGIIIAEVKTKSQLNKEDADILPSHDPPTVEVAYILSLGVLQQYRKMGIASLLLDSLLSYLRCPENSNCKAAYLHVLSTNVNAITFYEHRSFIAHCFLPCYYHINQRPQDGYSYVLYMNGGQPPGSLLSDYVSQCGSIIAKLHPCALPLQIVKTVHNWLGRLFQGTTSTSHKAQS